jgi:hypothetical protein
VATLLRKIDYSIVLTDRRQHHHTSGMPVSGIADRRRDDRGGTAGLKRPTGDHRRESSTTMLQSIER